MSGPEDAGQRPIDLLSTMELIRAARSGDRAAHDELASRFFAPLRRWAAGRLPARARTMISTDDLVQDTLLRTLRRIDVLEPAKVGGFQSYLRQGVINRIRDELRRTAVRPVQPAAAYPAPGNEPQDAGPSPLERLLGKEALSRYDEALARLREADREAILARVELGLDYAEIAQALGKSSRDAARMAVSRAMVRLAEELARDE